MPLPSQPKNQQVRMRGATLGEAGADHPYGTTSKPMLDERRSQPVPTDKIDLPKELREQPQGPYSRDVGTPEAVAAHPDRDPAKKKTGEF